MKLQVSETYNYSVSFIFIFYDLIQCGTDQCLKEKINVVQTNVCMIRNLIIIHYNIIKKANHVYTRSLIFYSSNLE